MDFEWLLKLQVIWQKDLAVGVEYITSGGKRGKIGCRKEVLLSAGSVKSPQILQLSGVGPLHVLEPLNVSTNNPSLHSKSENPPPQKKNEMTLKSSLSIPTRNNDNINNEMK